MNVSKINKGYLIIKASEYPYSYKAGIIKTWWWRAISSSMRCICYIYGHLYQFALTHVDPKKIGYEGQIIVPVDVDGSELLKQESE